MSSIDCESLGFGTYRLKADDAYTGTLHALNTGYSWIDTAPLYGNLVHVGRAIGDSGRSRNSFKVTTKISRDTLKNIGPNSMVESFFNTMRELRLDYVDELILHEPIDILRNWSKLCALFNNEGRGLIKRIGVSNFDEYSLQQIIEDSGIVPHVNQIEINPFLTRGNLPTFCSDRGIQIVAHSPLAKGEKLDDSVLKEIADRYDISCAQLMLRWGTSHDFRVIPRSKNRLHIEENIKISFKIDSLDLKTMETLDCGYATHPKYLKM